MGMQLETSPFLTHTPTRKEEALQWAEAALSSRAGITGPEAYVGGKGVLRFGLGFFHEERTKLFDSNPIEAVVSKAFLVKNDGRY